MSRRGRGRPPHPDALTPAERRVLEELRKGGTNAEIAVRVGIGPETVKTHVSNMLAKLELEDRTQLAAWREEDVPRPRRRWLFAPSLLKPLVVAGVVAGVAVLVVVALLLLALLGGGGDVAPSLDDTSAVVEVSVGQDHTCVLRESGAVLCWGENAHGQLDAPSGPYRSISAGWQHTCAVRESGEIDCWGLGGEGQTDAPPGNYGSVSAGRLYTCAVRLSGELACWGVRDPRSEAPPGRYRAVAAGANHTCAVRETGDVLCWGRNWQGQTDAPAGLFRSLTVGSRHTCGVRTTGRVECWGHIQLVSGRGFPHRSISTGRSLTCVVNTDRRVFCWDTGLLTRLKGCTVGDWDEVVCAGGDAISIFLSSISRTDARYRSVSAGAFQACAVTESDTVECWGPDGSPPVDVPTALPSPEPTR